MIIKLVRHGESEANVGKVNSTEIGDAFVRLTPTGIEQAKNVGRTLGAEFVQTSLLYTSPYMRSRQTMYGLIDGSNVIHQGGISRIYEDPRLRESEFGYNKQPDHIKEEKRIRDQHSYFLYRYSGGQSPADVYDRISGFLETLRRQVERKNIPRVIISSHGITIRVFAMRFMHLTIDQFDAIENPNNCDIITIAPLASREITDPQFKSGKWGIQGLRWQ